MLELISPISKLIEVAARPLGSYLGKRRLIFDEIMTPMFDQLLLIHNDYLGLFNSTLKRLPVEIEEQGWFNYDFEPLDRLKPEFTIEVAKAKRELVEGRESFEAQRIQIRALAAAVIQKDFSSEEKRFLYGVLAYFLYPESSLIAWRIDGQIETMETRGPVSAWDTPSSSAAELIEHEKDPNKIRETLSSSKMQQLERWTEICRLFAELKAEVKTGLY